MRASCTSIPKNVSSEGSQDTQMREQIELNTPAPAAETPAETPVE